MKEIFIENLNKIEKEYSKNIGYTIARRALNKTKISDLSIKSEQTEYTRNAFSIDLKTLS